MAGRAGLDEVLGPLTLLLVLVYVLVNPVLMVMLALFLLPFLLIGWLIGRMGMMWLLLLVRPGGRRPADPPLPTLAFRTDDGSRVTEVRLFGHDAGVQLGDTVEVRGVPVGGTLHATRVANRTTGAVLRRRGTVRLAVLAVADLWLVLAIVASVAAR